MRALLLCSLLTATAAADTSTPAPAKAAVPKPCTAEFKPIATAIRRYCKNRHQEACDELVESLQRCDLYVTLENGALEVHYIDSDHVWPYATLKLVDGKWDVLSVVYASIPHQAPKF
jgi:hypothetical protein